MNVTQKDFEYMKEVLIREILTILVEEYHMTIPQAFEKLYTSDLLKKIENPKTGLFFQSPRYVLSELM
jgi:hypothetical protein